MILTKEQQAEFEKVTRPVLKYLCEHFHPHVTIVIDSTRAELLEGIISWGTEEYIKD